jgi:hypothetical protein
LKKHRREEWKVGIFDEREGYHKKVVQGEKSQKSCGSIKEGMIYDKAKSKKQYI